MEKKTTILLTSILITLFLAVQACSSSGFSTGLAAECVGEGDIVCDEDEYEAYQCQLATYGLGYYTTRASGYDVSDCGATEDEEADLSSYETLLEGIDDKILLLSDSYADAKRTYANADGTDAAEYMILKRQLISVLEDIDTQQTKLADIETGLAADTTDLQATVDELQSDLDSLATKVLDLLDDVQTSLDSLRTACSADTDCLGYRCKSGYCVYSCSSDLHCDSTSGYECDETTSTCTTSSSGVDCTDTDAGQDYEVYGLTTVTTDAGSTLYTESCSDDTLREYYCSGDESVAEDYDCPYGCESGACVECDANDDCDSGYGCNDEYVCAEECSDDDDCGDYNCDWTPKLCYTSCTSDDQCYGAHCDTTTSTCTDVYPCDGNEDCIDNLACDTTAGECYKSCGYNDGVSCIGGYACDITVGSYPPLGKSCIVDADSDGLEDTGEDTFDTYDPDPTNPDTDDDGLSDGDEVYLYFADPEVSNILFDYDYDTNKAESQGMDDLHSVDIEEDTEYDYYFDLSGSSADYITLETPIVGEDWFILKTRVKSSSTDMTGTRPLVVSSTPLCLKQFSLSIVNGKYEFSVFTDQGQVKLGSRASVTPEADTWQDVTAIYNYDVLQLYVDDVLVDEKSITESSINQGFGVVYIGYSDPTCGSNDFEGYIDYVEVLGEEGEELESY